MAEESVYQLDSALIKICTFTAILALVMEEFYDRQLESKPTTALSKLSIQ